MTSPASTAVQPPRGPLFVLSGPSGSGKTTVVDLLQKVCAYPLYRVVTATTRLPRPGEVNGIHYHFWSESQFAAESEAGRMLEVAEVFGQNHYGTPRSEVEPKRDTGYGVMLVIDVQGAVQVRKQYGEDCITIFLDVPSLAILEQRLRDRKTETEERIKARLTTAQAERLEAAKYQHRVVNDDLERTVLDLNAILTAEFQRRGLAPCSTN
jgi:guanylate kinase